jgi:hypothetical protein
MRYLDNDYNTYYNNNVVSTRDIGGSKNDCQFKYNFEGGNEYTVRGFLEKKTKKLFEAQEYKYYIKIYGRLPKNLRGFNSGELKETALLFLFLIRKIKK